MGYIGFIKRILRSVLFEMFLKEFFASFAENSIHWRKREGSGKPRPLLGFLKVGAFKHKTSLQGQ